MANKAVLFITILVISVILKTAMFTQSHSGEGKPPMFGDFEAQRHWLEITNHIPRCDWYRNTTRNDLQYWGLDYPPLTALHSQLMGAIGHCLTPTSFALHTSRGAEDAVTKLFMRMSVLVTDAVLYTPFAMFAVSVFGNSSSSSSSSGDRQGLALFLLLCNPALLIIDYGHFQYNVASLGPILLCAALLVRGHHMAGAALCMASVMYKQMSLYYTPTVFFFVLGDAWQRGGAKHVARSVALCGIAVVVVVAASLAPWALCAGDGEALCPGRSGDVLVRMFPVGRGLYEDKVANVWCAISPVLKLQRVAAPNTVLMICTACTLVAFLPSAVLLCRRPSPRALLHNLVVTCLSFFLFSFHVHEKTILIPLIPAALLCLVCSPDAVDDAVVQYLHFLFVALFSMAPLLKKDGLLGPYVISMVCVAYAALFHFNNAKTKHRLFFVVSLLGVVVLHVAEGLIKPPPRYPDVHVLVQSAFSAAHFILIHVVLTLSQRNLVDSSSPRLLMKTKLKKQ
eukprot:PhM_4_TR6265/c0_g1_i1/m.83105/K03848/ALG6; alpha-1,3-glucosyltransferase